MADEDQRATVTVQEFHRSLYVCLTKRLLNLNDTAIEKGDSVEQTVTEDGALVIRPTQNTTSEDDE